MEVAVKTSFLILFFGIFFNVSNSLSISETGFSKDGMTIEINHFQLHSWNLALIGSGLVEG